MKDPKTENYLNSGNYVWKYTSKVLLADIDIKASIENPSRLLRAVNQEVALTYGLAMEAGDIFPAMVLLLRERAVKPFDIATGVHRFEGARLAHLDHFDAYIVTEPDAYREELLIRQLNTIEGMGVTIDDRIAQVLLMFEKYPDKPLTHHAREWNLKEGAVQSAWQMQTALKRAQRCGYDLSKAKVHKGATVALNGIRNDAVYQRAVQLAITPGVSAKQIEEMVRDIKKAPHHTEAAEVVVVERYAHDAAQARIQANATRGRTSPTAATKLIGDCKSVLRQIERGIEQLHLRGLTDPYSAFIVIEETMKHLKSVATELERVRRIRQSATATTTAVH